MKYPSAMIASSSFTVIVYVLRSSYPLSFAMAKALSCFYAGTSMATCIWCFTDIETSLMAPAPARLIRAVRRTRLPHYCASTILSSTLAMRL